MSGIVLGLTRRSYDRIRKELEDCRRRITAIATEENETEYVYRLNMQLFPMSGRLGTGKKSVLNKEDKK